MGQEQQEQGQLVKLTGLWLNDGKAGKYMAGNLGGARVLIFKNNKKQKDSDPDYALYIAPAKPKKDQAGAPKGQQAEDDISF